MNNFFIVGSWSKSFGNLDYGVDVGEIVEGVDVLRPVPIKLYPSPIQYQNQCQCINLSNLGVSPAIS